MIADADAPTLPAGPVARRTAAEAGEDLERIVVDRGGTPLVVNALEITALFGVPLALGDDAERAARAAQALISHAGGRAGLDTVRVVLRPGAAPFADADALAGATALAEAAPRGAVVASAVTARQLAARFDLAADPAQPTARRVLGPRPAAIGALAATFRDRELGALVGLAEDCFAQRRPRHGEVRAPAGYGKTQLRDALIARLRERREVDWLVAQAAATADAGPLGVLRAADPEWFAAATAGGLGDRAAVFAAARAWLEARAERCPVCVVVDDLQWADPLSRELIADLVGALDAVPVFVATFVRITDSSAAPGTVPGVDAFTLGAMDPHAATDLVRQLAPGATPDTIADVVRRAAGNPFFLEELAREVAERGPGRGRGTTLPPTVEAVVQARLDHLATGARDLLTTAAVIGPIFGYDALAALAGARTDSDRAELDAHLAELERLGMIAPVPLAGDDPEAERYRFVHDLVRDVAYARQSASDRRAAHAALASWLRRRHPALVGLAAAVDAGSDPGVAVDVIAAYAHQLAAADDDATAAVAFRVAGMRYLEAAAYHDAAEALRRSAALAPAVDAELAIAIGDAVLQAESVGAAQSWYRRALATLEAGGDAAIPRRALAWHKLGTAATRGADWSEALACFEAGLALVAPGSAGGAGEPPRGNDTLAPWAMLDPRTAAQLYGSLGWVAGYMLGDTARALPACRRAVALLEGTPYRRELAHALSRLGAALMRANRFAEQLECNRKNLAIGIEIGDAMMQLTARINLGVALGVRGEIDEAVAHTELARGLAAHSGARSAAGLIESNLAGLYLEQGRLDDADRCLADGLVLAEKAGARAGLTETYGYAARLRAARGDLAGAERWARQSLALADQQGLKLDQGIALRLLAQIAARAGRLTEAHAFIADSAIRLVDVDGYEQARTEAARARILTRAGDPAAAAARTHALAELTRFGARRDLEVLDDPDEVR